MRSRRLLPALLALGSGLALAACNPLSPAGPAPRIYTIAAPRSVATTAPAVRWQLLVEVPTAAGDLDTVRIATRLGPTRIDYYADAQWSDRVPVLLQRLLVESFEASGRIPSVGRQTYGLDADFVLATDLRDFEIDASGSPTAEVALAAKLISTRSRAIVASRTFSAAMPAQGSDLNQLVDALGAATDRLMPQVVDWALAAGADAERGTTVARPAGRTTAR